MAHTPGLWHIEYGTQPWAGYYIYSSSGQCIAGTSFEDEESHANAVLMASAPKLLSVCQKLADQLGQKILENGGNIEDPLMLEATSVIAEAQGKRFWDKEKKASNT